MGLVYQIGGTTDMPVRWLSWIRDRQLDSTSSKYSGAMADREHNKFREFRGAAGRTVLAVADDDGLPLNEGVEHVLGEILAELQAIRVGMEMLTEEPLKEDVA